MTAEAAPDLVIALIGSQCLVLLARAQSIAVFDIGRVLPLQLILNNRPARYSFASGLPVMLDPIFGK